MTVNEFNALCEQYGVSPDVALECEAVTDALRERDDAAVQAALEENF